MMGTAATQERDLKQLAIDQLAKVLRDCEAAKTHGTITIEVTVVNGRVVETADTIKRRYRN